MKVNIEIVGDVIEIADLAISIIGRQPRINTEQLADDAMTKVLDALKAAKSIRN